MSTTIRTAELLETAANKIKASADELKRSHTINDFWPPSTDQADIDAMIDYVHSIQLAKHMLTEASRIRETTHAV